MEVRGADDTVALVEHIIDLPAAEHMVARGYHVDAAVKEILRRGGRNTVADRGILAVRNAKVDGLELLISGQLAPQEFTAHRRYDVADSKDIHSFPSVKCKRELQRRSPLV